MAEATIVAQGGMGEGLAPLCEFIGFSFCLAFVVAIAVFLIGRVKNSRSKTTPTIATISLAGMILCVVYLESMPTSAWRTFARTHAVQVVDKVTGKPLAIKYEWRVDLPDDPFIECGMHLPQPDQLDVRSNVDFPLEVWADGYGRNTIDLTTSSPERIVVSLTRAATLPATRPD